MTTSHTTTEDTMTNEQTPQGTLAQLREAAASNHAIGCDLAGLAGDVEYLIRQRDEARADVETLERLVPPRIAYSPVASRTAASLQEAINDMKKSSLLYVEPDPVIPRVITPDELREGQVVVVWESGARPQPVGDVIQIRSIEHLDDGSIDLRAPGECCNFNPHDEQAVLLADAPADTEPEPWEPSEGDVGIVTHFRGRALDEPVGAWFTGLSWYRLDRRNWPDETPMARTFEVRVTRAKVVPDDAA